MMGLIIRGSFQKVAELRDFIQGKDEPYIGGTRAGYSYFGMVDDMGDGLTTLFLSDASIAKKNPEDVRQIRQQFVSTLKKSAPYLSITHG